MKFKSLSFLVSVFTIGILLITLTASEPGSGTYLLIKHVGIEDKPVPALIITAEKVIAERVNDTKLPEVRRVIVVEPDSYAKFQKFFHQERVKAPKLDRQKSANDFGVFEVSERATDDFKQWLFIISGDYATKFFSRSSSFATAEQLSPDVVSELNYLQLRCINGH